MHSRLKKNVNKPLVIYFSDNHLPSYGGQEFGCRNPERGSAKQTRLHARQSRVWLETAGKGSGRAATVLLQVGLVQTELCGITNQYCAWL